MHDSLEILFTEQVLTTPVHGDICILDFDDILFIIKFKEGSCSALQIRQSNSIQGYFVFRRPERLVLSMLHIGDNFIITNYT